MHPELPKDPGHRAELLSRARDWVERGAHLHAFGGRPLLDAALPLSPRTGLPLHLSFDLDLADPRLAGLGVLGLSRLAVPVNYSLDADSGVTWVRHLDGGRRLELIAEPDGERFEGAPDELPQLPVLLRPLSEAEAMLETIDELPTGSGPLHQVGGRPLWFGDPLPPPACPETGEPMIYVATVDSMLRFPLGGRDAPLLFGDCGMMHVWWSAAARMTAGVLLSG